MTKKNKTYIGIVICLLFLGILVVSGLKFNCVFKQIFHIPCPGCGLTRAFKSILSGHILLSFKYNILAIPLLVGIIYLLVIIVLDIIKKTSKLSQLIDHKVGKYSLIIFILLLISEILNIVRGI